METAMDIVRRAADGKIDHDELIQILKTWAYEPQYKTTGLGDDWQSVPNSFDAVEFAYMSLELLTDGRVQGSSATPFRGSGLWRGRFRGRRGRRRFRG